MGVITDKIGSRLSVFKCSLPEAKPKFALCLDNPKNNTYFCSITLDEKSIMELIDELSIALRECIKYEPKVDITGDGV